MLENRTERVEEPGLSPKGTMGAQSLTCCLKEVADCRPEIVALVTRGESALRSCWTVSSPLICLLGHGSVCVLCFHVSVATMPVISREGRLPVPWLLSLWWREGATVEHAHSASEQEVEGAGSRGGDYP
jgi:hypothetical protein